MGCSTISEVVDGPVIKLGPRQMQGLDIDAGCGFIFIADGLPPAGGREAAEATEASEIAREAMGNWMEAWSQLRPQLDPKRRVGGIGS